MLKQKMKQDVLGLSPLDKIHLAEMILDSLDQPSSDVEKKWIDESEKRFQAYKENKVNGISLSDVKDKYEE